MVSALVDLVDRSAGSGRPIPGAGLIGVAAGDGHTVKAAGPVTKQTGGDAEPIGTSLEGVEDGFIATTINFEDDTATVDEAAPLIVQDPSAAGRAIDIRRIV